MTIKLYNTEDLKIMETTRASINKSRMQELKDFIKHAEYKKVGIANCLSMQKYADKLAEILKEECGVEVVSVNCKDGGLTNADLFGPEARGPSCDPAYQAKVLNEGNTEFNIKIGLCLGHEVVFDKYVKTPATTLVVKDFSTTHQSAQHLV